MVNKHYHDNTRAYIALGSIMQYNSRCCRNYAWVLMFASKMHAFYIGQETMAFDKVFY